MINRPIVRTRRLLRVANVPFRTIEAKVPENGEVAPRQIIVLSVGGVLTPE